MNKKSFILKILPFLLFAIIIWIAYEQKDAVLPLLQKTKFNWLLAGFFFYLFNYITRATRLRLLVGTQQFSFLTGLKMSSLHGFFSYFLPFRSGDLSLPVFLKKFGALPFTTGGAILLRARLLDMFSLGILLFCTTLLSFYKLDIKFVSLFLLVSVVLLGTPLLVGQKLFRKWDIRTRWIKLLFDNVSLHPKSYKETGLSLLIWFWTGCTLFSATKALSIPIQFLDIWFLVAAQLPLQLFPIQGIANAGNHEIGWVAGFTILGISAEKSLEFALASHLIIILYVLTLGVFGLIVPATKSHSSTRS